MATAADPFGEWRDPVLVLKVGDGGVGKSADDAYAFAESGVFLCAHPDGIKAASATGWALRDDQIRPCYSLTQASNTAWEIVKDAQKDGPKYRAIVIDDLTFMVRHEHRAMMQEAQYRVHDKKTGVWTGDYNFKLWSDIAARIETFVEIGRYQGWMHTMINSHARDPDTDERTGQFYKGGPWMPSSKIVKVIPHLATTCARIVSEIGREPWHAMYDLRPETISQWHTKDRHGFSGLLPLNTAELLRNAGTNGYYVPRPAPLAWIEEWAAVLSTRLLEGKPQSEIVRKCRDALLARSYDPLHIRWALRDGIDRAAFIKSKANILAWC